MDRHFSRRFRSLAALAVVALLLASAGCMAPILTGMYLFGAADTKAQYKELKKKKVVVVCHPITDLQYSNMSAVNEISRQIGLKLKENVSSLKLVDPQAVERWMDENQWEDAAEIGRAFQADKVVLVELESFSVLLGQTLYQGKASYALKVIDCKTGEVDLEASPNPVSWPENSAVSTSEKPENKFRMQFIGVLADKIARHFYSYDARNYFADDATAFD